MTDPKKLTAKHEKLVHTENVKVTSHVQRAEGEWIINTVMIEGVDVPFRYKRKQQYRDLTGARVNLTYYPDTLTVAGMAMEIMSVVRIRVA
jgi:hypothetical protein